MEKVRLSKSLRKSMKKSSDKFVNDIYFNPRRRKELRESFAKSLEGLLKILEKPQGSNPSIDQARERSLADAFSDPLSRMIDLIDFTVPRKLKEFELTNSRFKLFKKGNSNFFVFECKYDKGIPKKHRLTYLLIPSGFPKSGASTKVRMIKGKYDLKGFGERDEGTFTQKFLSFVKVHLTFKGKTRTIRFELTQRGKVKDNNWLRILK